MTPETLLACTLTYREAPQRTERVPTEYEDVDAAVATFTKVLLHEAHEAMQAPLAAQPTEAYLHPVDIDTSEPGIVTSRTDVQILRNAACGRVEYTKRKVSDSPPQNVATVASSTHEDAAEVARAQLAEALSTAEKKASAASKRAARSAALKEKRENETPEERTERLAVAKAKREAKQASKAQTKAERMEKPEKLETPSMETIHPDDFEPDDSMTVLLRPPPKRKRTSKVHFFAHPMPHHRHLDALQVSNPHPSLLPALLRGEPRDALKVIQGPPGTGKTRALVDLIDDLPSSWRVLLVAPTNVGAANLYTRCISKHVASLALAPSKIPLGTTVLDTDPTARLVCATISARGGPILDSQRFDAVLVDEAAQCIEAWVWTLFRPEVCFVALAGDVKQLPSVVSETGREFGHDISLMERLVKYHAYPTTLLTEQNRMAPELLAFPNATFYEGMLTTGPAAPTSGEVSVFIVEEGEEAQHASGSFYNKAEARAVAAWLTEQGTIDDAVLITPYTAQCQELLALKTGYEVHTVDSFQGREADTVVLCCVRDGTHGIGFWEDARRLTVALTRAKTRLVLVCTSPERWPKCALADFVAKARPRA